jgi:radical SAM protein with 4Fe4S-binding SPASM domain
MLGGIMGVSTKGWFVNVDLLKKAGYTLEDITSFEKVAEIAQTAHKKGLCKYGYTPYESFEIQNMLCYQGIDIFDKENGFAGVPTKCLLGEGEAYSYMKKLTETYAKMAKDGTYYLRRTWMRRLWFNQPCYRLWSGCVITAEGELLPCCYDKAGNYSFGSLQRESLATIWHNRKADNFRYRVLHDNSSLPICQECNH